MCIAKQASHRIGRKPPDFGRPIAAIVLPLVIVEGEMKKLLMVILLLSCGAVLVRAVQPVAVSVYPAVTMVRGSTRVLVRIEANELNRKLVWEVDGPDYFRSSSIQLDGASAPRSFRYVLSDVPAGEYNVRARVIRNNDSESMASTTMAVVRHRARQRGAGSLT